VQKRLEFAGFLRDGFARGETAAAWRDALPAIHAAYPGLALGPQLGLLPIGADPDSGLFEFAHLATGAPALRGADGKLVIAEETGLVFVLLPGGGFLMGAQAVDPAEANYDPRAASDESPMHEVTLSPFFFSKYEMTQGQWLRVTGRNPSSHHPPGERVNSLTNPVETVSWIAAKEVTERLGLSLPSEAQWEYGARGGTATRHWTGDERDSLVGAVNLADQAARRAGAHWPAIEEWPELDDGFVFHAPVDRFRPNGFGLHNPLGNVWEWCLDGYDGAAYQRSASRDPLSEWRVSPFRVMRGGAYDDAAGMVRSARRFLGTPDVIGGDLGLRPVRRVMH
jgi:formylglycine-generating enzyme required for sulfatase activity